MQNNEQHLSPTSFCDANDELILLAARKLYDADTPTSEKALTIFEFVRDGWAFGMDASEVKASQTLTKGYGACWNKALLLMAILRAAGIPARLARYPLDRKFLKPFLSLGYLVLQQPFYHYIVEIFLDDRWIEVDASLDIRTFETFYKKPEIIWNINWDGKTPHTILTEYHMGPLEHVEDIDACIFRGVDNNLLKGSLGKSTNSFLNRPAWKLTGWLEDLPS